MDWTSCLSLGLSKDQQKDILLLLVAKEMFFRAALIIQVLKVLVKEDNFNVDDDEDFSAVLNSLVKAPLSGSRQGTNYSKTLNGLSAIKAQKGGKN